VRPGLAELRQALLANSVSLESRSRHYPISPSRGGGQTTSAIQAQRCYLNCSPVQYAAKRLPIVRVDSSAAAVPLPAGRGGGRASSSSDSGRVGHGAAAMRDHGLTGKASSPSNAMALARDGRVQLSRRGCYCRAAAPGSDPGGRCPGLFTPPTTAGRTMHAPQVAPIGPCSGEACCASGWPGDSRSQPLDYGQELKLADANPGRSTALAMCWAPPNPPQRRFRTRLISGAIHGMTTPAGAPFERLARRCVITEPPVATDLPLAAGPRGGRRDP